MRTAKVDSWRDEVDNRQVACNAGNVSPLAHRVLGLDELGVETHVQRPPLVLYAVEQTCMERR
jgi:hypothetical protein